VEQMLESASLTSRGEDSNDDEADEEDGSTSKDVKIEVQVLNMDEDGGFDSEELAQMMQSMFQGDASSGDMGEMINSMFEGDGSDSGVLSGAMEAIMQAVLQQQGQMGGDDDDESAEEVDMEGF